MSPSDAIGSLGLLLLLGAFAGNVVGRLTSAMRAYQALNFLGSGILVWYSWQIGSVVFLVLEAVWSAFALGSLLAGFRARGASSA